MSNQLTISEAAKIVSKVKKAFQSALNKNKKLKADHAIFDAELAKWNSFVVDEMKVPVGEHRRIKELELTKLVGVFDSRLYKFTQRRREDLEEIILFIASQLYENHRSNFALEILERFYPSYKDEQDEAEAEQISDFLTSQFGIEIDPDEIKGLPVEEVLAKFHEKLDIDEKERAQEQYKTQKQQAQEIRAKKDEDLLDMDIKLLYKELVMKLHPDMEMDAAIKLEKEELMKIANGAREQNDIFELLQLRLLVFEGQEDDAIFGDDTMKRLTKLLKEKNNQLQNRIMHKYHASRVVSVQPDYKKFLKNPDSIKELCLKEANSLKQKNLQFQLMVDSLETNASYNHFIDEIIPEIRLMQMQEMFDDFDIDDDLFDF